jgi:hypothetical protein
MRALLAAVALLVAGPAMAGQGLYCVGDSEPVEVSLQMAGGVGFSLLGGDIRLDDRVWATDFGALPYDVTAFDAETVIVAQAAMLGEMAIVDFADEDAIRTVAELRYFVVQEGDEPTIAGTLRIGGVGAWAVSCSAG